MAELDDVQRRAVESDAETVIVSGGPGTGKTHLLTLRFAHLAKSRGVPLSSILLLTFSSASAARLRRDIEEMIRQSYDELWIHTCQSFASSVLTEHASLAGPSPTPVLVPPFKEYLVMKELLRREHGRFRSGLKAVALKDGLAREISDFFGLLKQHLIGPTRFGEVTQNLTPELRDLGWIYSAYEKYMNERNWVGFRDAVARVLDIFEADPKLLSRYRMKFSHILVDEFQEIDSAQLRLIELLASEHTCLFVAGDEEQRIYRFRGSGVGQFSDITEARGKADVFRLGQNYRLSSALRKASQSLIAHNNAEERAAAPLALSEELNVSPYKDAIEQAYAIARDIKCMVLDGAAPSSPVCYSDFAVLSRSTFRSAAAFEEAFSYYDIPYVLYNCTSFYKHPMVRCVADLVRLLANPDDDRALLRVLGVPAFRLDAVELRRLAEQRKGAVGTASLYETLRLVVHDGAPKGLEISDEETARGLRECVRYFEGIRREASSADCPSALIQSIMSKLFYEKILGSRGIAEGVRDARNLRLLYEVVADIERIFTETRGRCTLSDIAEYMDHAFVHFSSQQENDPSDESADGVRIMTAHQAKGMEFRFVYLVDMTDEYFPMLGRVSSLLDGKSLEKLSGAVREHGMKKKLSAGGLHFLMTPQEQLKEERQLAYVALTRARERLTVCFTEESHLSEPVQPSPFIEELIGLKPDETSKERSSFGDSSDARIHLAASLNKQEIEGALRACVQSLPLGVDAARELFRFFESLGLDASFVCAESPFEREPRQAPNLAGHRYSASQLATYVACPRRFFFEKILRVAPERPEDFGLGQLVHLVLEKFHKKVKRFSGDRNALETELRRTFETIWKGSRGKGDSQTDAFCKRFATALQRAAVRHRAEEILRRYLATELAQAGDREIIACEKRVEFSVRDYPFVAKIDRIESSPEGDRVIDYKTSGAGPKGARVIKKRFLNVDGRADYTPEDFQLPLYLLAARNAGHDPVALTYYWLAQEDASGMFKKSSLRVCEDKPDCLSAGDMQVVQESIVAVVNRIAAGEFDPKPKSSFECARCSFDCVCNLERQDAEQDDR